MIIRSADYIKSSAKLSQCPESDIPEYAFIGRSNVGKSSLINLITGRNKLAHISGTPGKTQLISHFLINEEWYLVDLPGYGYAKRSKSARAEYDKMIRSYLSGRENLMQVFLLIDSRLKPQANDLDFMRWLADEDLPFILLFTKSDKLSANALKEALKTYKELLMLEWAELPPAIVTSSQTRLGREDVLGVISELNALFGSSPDLDQ